MQFKYNKMQKAGGGSSKTQHSNLLHQVKASELVFLRSRNYFLIFMCAHAGRGIRFLPRKPYTRQQKSMYAMLHK